MYKSASDEMAQMILETVARIPYGKVASYGQIAAMTGLPRHARMVGRVLNQLDVESDIPWHRVINSQGRISHQRLDDHGFNCQQARLLEEGILIHNGKINFKIFGWFE
jgi:methylated-DNA-protein-cysteine methyltransferase related protein